MLLLASACWHRSRQTAGEMSSYPANCETGNSLHSCSGDDHGCVAYHQAVSVQAPVLANMILQLSECSYSPSVLDLSRIGQLGVYHSRGLHFFQLMQRQLVSPCHVLYCSDMVLCVEG